MPAAAQPPAPATPDYSEDSSWLCLPGRADVCSDAAADDRAQSERLWLVGQSNVAKDPPLDCFYVYPTVSQRPRPEQRHDRRPRGEARGRDPVRALRLGVPAVRAGVPADDARLGRRIFRRRGHHECGERSPTVTCSPRGAITSRARNGGRPFVLIGHSQGSLMLQQLITREIETSPAVAAPDEARDHPRLQRAGPARQARRRHFQEDAAVQRSGRDRLRDGLEQLSREERSARSARCSGSPTSRA